MKHLIIFIIFSLIMIVSSQDSFAQQAVHTFADLQVAEDQKRLHNADSISKVNEARASITRMELKQAQDELKAAQKRYSDARQNHKQAVTASKEAKRSYEMEMKAQKARKNAEDQATKARSAALRSEGN